MVKESYHHLTQQRHRHEIKGVVKDSKKLILPGVTVTLENLRDHSKVMAVTDEQGVFEIKSLGPGEYQLTLQLEGFETINQKVALSGEFPLILDFRMKIAGYSEEIVVTATKTAEFLESVPVRVTLIPSREIEQK
ncbi:MAG: carboxypeptidase regulatory-like domain-containing protein, partial [Desulfatiglandales bacterium]